MGVEELAERLAQRDCSSSELWSSCHAAAASWQASLNAFSKLLDEPPTTAEAPASLWGIPYALKENMAASGLPLSCGSKILSNYRPPYDATVTRRLHESGATLLGLTNMDEFAMGSSTENSAHGPSRNPWDTGRTPGGSSGGAAAAVGASILPFALGSDTGGSIRQPAGFFGCVGFKPSYGRVSRYGLVAFASSLDQIGPITRSVRDAALVYGFIAGHDPADATSLEAALDDGLESIEDGPRGLRIGVPWKLLEAGVDGEVRENLRQRLQDMVAEGAELIDLELPLLEHAIATYYIVATAEASSNLARYDGVRYGLREDAPNYDAMVRATRTAGFGDEVKLRILLGTYVLSAGYYEAHYLKAQQVRTLMTQELDAAFSRCDVLALPTSPTPAFKLGDRTTDPLQMYLSDVFTVTANLTGVPAIALPSGLSGEGLPLSIQLMGRRLEESQLLRAARALEKVCGFDELRKTHGPTVGGGAHG